MYHTKIKTTILAEGTNQNMFLADSIQKFYEMGLIPQYLYERFWASSMEVREKMIILFHKVIQKNSTRLEFQAVPNVVDGKLSPIFRLVFKEKESRKVRLCEDTVFQECSQCMDCN